MGCVKCLVENGASLYVQDGAGMTPLEVANQSNNLDVVTYLVKMLGAYFH
jgi:ankyrin repeat protein